MNFGHPKWFLSISVLISSESAKSGPEKELKTDPSEISEAMDMSTCEAISETNNEQNMNITKAISQTKNIKDMDSSVSVSDASTNDHNIGISTDFSKTKTVRISANVETRNIHQKALATINTSNKTQREQSVIDLSTYDFSQNKPIKSRKIVPKHQNNDQVVDLSSFRYKSTNADDSSCVDLKVSSSNAPTVEENFRYEILAADEDFTDSGSNMAAEDMDYDLVVENSKDQDSIINLDPINLNRNLDLDLNPIVESDTDLNIL
jgi:hypothetical protein